MNSKIWNQLDNFKRKVDLRLGNIQQALQKARFGILKSCHSLVSNQSGVNEETFGPVIYGIAPMGHAVSGLSRLRRDQVKPALKREFYSLCTAANESSFRHPRVFGMDVAKRIRDAKDANNICQKIGAEGRSQTRGTVTLITCRLLERKIRKGRTARTSKHQTRNDSIFGSD